MSPTVTARASDTTKARILALAISRIHFLGSSSSVSAIQVSCLQRIWRAPTGFHATILATLGAFPVTIYTRKHTMCSLSAHLRPDRQPQALKAPPYPDSLPLLFTSRHSHHPAVPIAHRRHTGEPMRKKSGSCSAVAAHLLGGYVTLVLRHCG